MLGPAILGEVDGDELKAPPLFLGQWLPKFSGLFSSHSRNVPTIHQPPGAALGAILRAAFGRRAYQRVFEPHIADCAIEWQEAHERNQLSLAKWIRVRCWIVLLWTAIGLLPLEKIIAFVTGAVGGERTGKGE